MFERTRNQSSRSVKHPARIAMVVALLACLSLALGACTSQEEKDMQALAEAELTQTTQYLEYADLDLDPLKLAECSAEEVELSADEQIDLRTVGVKEVAYRVSKGSASEERTLTFTVRDTKAPQISIEKEKIEIDQGGSFDPASNITSVDDPVDGALAVSSDHLDSTEEDPGYQKYYDEGWYAITGDFDADKPGTYDFEVIACDINGNRASKSFSLVVNEVVPPEPEPEPEPVAAASQESDKPETTTSSQASQPAEHSYVLNTNTMKFHYPDCSSVNKMSTKNRQDVEMTREDVIAAGYSPCQRCNP